ncbi:hypothetical protein [Streptomyces sp. NPDC004250]|uniref:hypothetical protein n=1 Tax=Streptomyces sp. NPDC004250 TaxID=3364692 RepID=UPI0036C9EDAC
MTLVTAESTASTTRTDDLLPLPRARRSHGRRSHGPARRSVRAAAVILGLVGTLALTACTDGGSDGGGSGGGGESSAAPEASASTDPSGGSGGSPSDAGELEGSWLATTDGQAVALMVTGGKAALFATGGTVCSGTAGEDAGTRIVRLKCTDGSDERSTGTVGSVDGKSLKMIWEGGLGEETYTKSEGGSLPPGLPTEGLGS